MQHYETLIHMVSDFILQIAMGNYHLSSLDVLSKNTLNDLKEDIKTVLSFTAIHLCESRFVFTPQPK